MNTTRLIIAKKSNLNKAGSARSLKLMEEMRNEVLSRQDLHSNECTADDTNESSSEEEEELDLDNINPEYKKCPIWMQRELVLEDRVYDLMMKHREQIKDVKRQIAELKDLKHRISIKVGDIKETIHLTKEELEMFDNILVSKIREELEIEEEVMEISSPNAVSGKVIKYSMTSTGLRLCRMPS